jgi:hypothetical protein
MLNDFNDYNPLQNTTCNMTAAYGGMEMPVDWSDLDRL